MPSAHLELGAETDGSEVLTRVPALCISSLPAVLNLARLQVEVRRRGAQRKLWQARVLMGGALCLAAIAALSMQTGEFSLQRSPPPGGPLWCESLSAPFLTSLTFLQAPSRRGTRWRRRARRGMQLLPLLIPLTKRLPVPASGLR